MKGTQTADTPIRSGSRIKRSLDLDGNALPLRNAEAGALLESPASSSDWSSELSVEEQRRREANNAIKYRTCSWQKVFLLTPHNFIWEACNYLFRHARYGTSMVFFFLLIVLSFLTQTQSRRPPFYFRNIFAWR